MKRMNAGDRRELCDDDHQRQAKSKPLQDRTGDKVRDAADPGEAGQQQGYARSQNESDS